MEKMSNGDDSLKALAGSVAKVEKQAAELDLPTKGEHFVSLLQHCSLLPCLLMLMLMLCSMLMPPARIAQ